MKRKWIFGVLALALLAVALLFHPWTKGRGGAIYSGTVETREIQIGSKIGGRVLQVAVEEGQRVAAGTLLVRFECEELKAQRAQAASKVEQARADLRRLEHGYRPEEIAQAEATVQEQRSMYEAAKSGARPQELQQAQAEYEAAQADAVNAETTFRRYEQLVRTDTISRQQFDDAKSKRDASQQKAESAHQRLALLQAGTRAEDVQAAQGRFRQAEAAAALAHRGYRREDIDAARSRLAEASQQVEELDVRLKEAELVAPANGVVEVVSVRPGDLVAPGRVVVSMLEDSQLWVKVYVPETELGTVKVGQSASVEVDAFPSRQFASHVEQIAAQAEFLPRNVQARDDREHQVFGVKVRVENPEGVLKSGMAATVRLQ